MFGSFGSTHGLEETGRIAHELGLCAFVGAWLSSDLAANELEISNAIAVAQAGHADMVIVGSEVLLRGDLSEADLLAYIDRVRQDIPPGIPVTTADVDSVLLAHPSVLSAVDVVAYNVYPYWEGVDVNVAVGVVNSRHQQIVAAAGGKEVVLSETGWPSGGNTVGEAVPSPENAAFYFLNVVSWARENNIPFWYFSALDETWKAAVEGPQGAHWGIFDKDGDLKPGMEHVFEGRVIVDNWSGTSLVGGPGDPAVQLRYIPPRGSFDDLGGGGLHVVPKDFKIVMYIEVDGRWWVKPTFASPLTSLAVDGGFTVDITTGGIDETASKIAVFLVPNGYDPPLLGGSLALPAELFDNSVANVQVDRSIVSISGVVTDGSTIGLGDLEVTADDGTVSLVVRTLANGKYSFPNLIVGAFYVVSPIAPGFLVSPASVTVPDLNGAEVVNFVAVGTGMPDLVVDTLMGPSTAQIGSQIPVSVTVRNLGTTPAGSFYVGFYFSTDSIITTSDPASESLCAFHAGLSAGQIATCEGFVNIPFGLDPGAAFLGAIVDDLDKVAEVNEVNNSHIADSGLLELMLSPDLPPSSNSVTPWSGSGTLARFRYVFSDSNGYGDMTSIQIVANETLSSSNSCYFHYVPAANQLYLRNDASSGWLGPQTVGTSGTLQNTKCSVDLGTSSVIGSGTNLTLNLAITFNTGGNKNQWMLAIDAAGQHLGWVLNGTWNAPGGANLSPTSDSVSPSSGSGASQTFSYVFSDLNGYGDMTSIQIVANETLSAGGSCYLYYVPAANQLYLRNDASSAWLGPQTVGVAGMLLNTKCGVDLGTSSAVGSGNSLTLELAMTFNTSGNKNQWMLAIDTAGQHLGWVLNGTWNVPGGANLPPTSDSVSPSSGSGASQTFSYVFSDLNGYGDMTSIQIVANETLSAGGSCYLYYVPAANQLYLRNDASSGWLGPQTVGVAGVLLNTKCGVDLATSSVVGSGNSLTLGLAMTFNTSGDKSQWMLAIDSAGEQLGWVLNGTWNVP